ncbi:MAG: M48 family metallopeptidase [Kordiimonadaceae bacterium]|nr:M48 family metallopeptidase [Kordiimonadaceae bacterium]
MAEALSVELAGESVPVTVRRNAQAKRLILRVDKTTGEIKLTLPKHVGMRAATKFIYANTTWLLDERQLLTPNKIIADSSLLPFLGDEQTVVFTGIAPRKVVHEGEQLMVGGPTDMAGKRLETWLRAQAKELLTERAALHAEKLGTKFKRVSIGDMKSRWGSCSSTGTLRFSWRLVLAPFEVLDYVAAHEVAHLLEMNHSDRFWAQVAICIPDHKARRRWLKTEGNALFKIRFNTDKNAQ